MRFLAPQALRISLPECGGCAGTGRAHRRDSPGLAGRRTAARAARGDAFDVKSWHMAALSLGALGLDDLTAELALL